VLPKSLEFCKVRFDAERKYVDVRQKGPGLGVHVGPRIEEAVRGHLLDHDLFLEQRAHDDAASTRRYCRSNGFDVF
jgi:hypothetical protein